ncbi:MAG TPA: type I-U CRISPR-associated RAMP protein Csb1/Cas7u [Urbifossiella sp.]|nr:type I-U CRISPR-associated RAMP protein Csb1/Cas7u [Urbifossiella sp.]
MPAPALTYDVLKAAVAGSAAAFRLTLKLEPVSPKVFPPTYEGGKYATEERIIGGQMLKCVLLDSVPSQANRMEAALQDAWDGGLIDLPVVTADFRAVENPGVPKVTSLQAPHRVADAILRDSNLPDGTKFRQSLMGKELDLLTTGYATPLLKYAPHCLVFGMWDSTGPRGGLGVKFARAVISEIIGVNAVPGKVTASRLDPLNIRAAATIYQRADGTWTPEEKEAKQEKGKPKKYKDDGSPSSANHSNIPPSFPTALDDNKRPLKDKNGDIVYRGGFTIDYAEQSTVLSLPALRRLRFPLGGGEKSKPDADTAARTYLAALGLLGATLAVEAGYDLRSRCVLRATDAVVWHLLGKPGDADTPLTLDRAGALDLYKAALAAVRAAGLPVQTDEVVLTPSADLVTLVKKSMEIAAVEAGEGNT